MAAVNYPAALQKVLIYEGGYSNDAGDPGGATQWGITHIDYDAYRNVRGLPRQDVRKMTTRERDEIYRKKYWDRPRCDELPGGVDFAVFDAAVNSGVAQGIKWLQRAVGVPADGAMGDVTMAAAQAADPGKTVANICDQRLAFLKRLRTWSRFGKGWGDRVRNVKRVGMAWAAVKQTASPPPGVGMPISLKVDGYGNGKASVSDVAQPSVSAETSGGATIAASASTGVVQQLQETATSLAPMADTLQIIKYVLIAITIITAGYTFYALYRRNKLKQVT